MIPNIDRTCFPGIPVGFQNFRGQFPGAGGGGKFRGGKFRGEWKGQAMLSINLIERHFQTGRFEPLLESLAANGMMLPLTLRVRLSQSHVPAVGLGLRRALELAYTPTPIVRRMAQYLCDVQGDDGSFDRDPLSTAVAAAALMRLLREPPANAEPAWTDSAQRAFTALAAMQHSDGLFNCTDDRTEQDRALTGAFILYLLAGDDTFRRSIRFAELMTWFEDHAERLDSDTNQLWQIARLDTPPPPETPDAADQAPCLAAAAA